MAFLVTLALGASIIYLLAELYKRVFLDWADSDAVATELGAPWAFPSPHHYILSQ